jgi:hypothetical protein
MATQEKRRILQVILVLVLCVPRLPAQPRYGGGGGTADDPYQIWTAEQMNAIGAEPNDWDKHFQLMADIDLSTFDGQEGRPAFHLIGYYLDWKPFTGVFDGNRHTIANFRYISRDTNSSRAPKPQNGVGLFACTGGLTGEIRNLGLIRPTVNVAGGSHVGALAGQGEGTISGCYVEEANVTGASDVGCLVGGGYALVRRSYSTGFVNGQVRVGGLAGKAWRVIDCYSTASVSGNDCAGGLVGAGAATGRRGGNLGLILNCYAGGRVTGIATGAGSRVTAATRVAGLIGAEGTNVVGSCWDIETSGQTESAGGSGKTTLEMQTAATFPGWGASDHNGVWTLDEGRDYPRLSWQSRPGQPLGTQLADLLAGSGTADDPFLIYTAQELQLIGLFPGEWNGCFRLMADVNLAAQAEAFNIIGVYEIPFRGVFDGNDWSISNLVLEGRGTGAGLFGYVDDPNAEIKNVHLLNGRMVASGYGGAGALVASLSHGSITNCHATDCALSGENDIGGLVGTNVYGTISDCSSTGTVVGTWGVGGLVGENNALLTRCSAAAVVNGRSEVGGLAGWNSDTVFGCSAASTVTGEWAGGLVGRNGMSGEDGIIRDSYARGTVSASFRAGGLVADNAGGTITNCYSTTAVTGTSTVGGLVAYDREKGLHITGSFWDRQTSGQAAGSAGTGLTTAQMQTEATFLAAGWDFVGETTNGTEDIWWIEEGKDYPRLWWEAAGE